MAPKRMSAPRTVGLTIAGTVGAALILSLLYAVLGLWRDVDLLKMKTDFYHGNVFPPPYIPGRERSRP